MRPANHVRRVTTVHDCSCHDVPRPAAWLNPRPVARPSSSVRVLVRPIAGARRPECNLYICYYIFSIHGAAQSPGALVTSALAPDLQLAATVSMTLNGLLRTATMILLACGMAAEEAGIPPASL